MLVKQISRIVFAFALLLIFLGQVAPLFAAELDYIPLAPLPGQDISGGVSLDKYLPYMFTLLIGVSALLAIVMIVAGGIKYMTTDIFSSKSNAKETIQNAIYGLLLVIASYMILYTVNPDLLSFRIQFPQLNNPGWGLIGLPSAPGGGDQLRRIDIVSPTGVVIGQEVTDAQGRIQRLDTTVRGVQADAPSREAAGRAAQESRQRCVDQGGRIQGSGDPSNPQAFTCIQPPTR